MGRRTDRENLRQRRKSGGIPSSATDKVRVLKCYRTLHRFSCILTTAALKAWLAQLQAKNEYLTQENQRLQEALVSTREELARLTAGAPLLPVGVTANAPPNAHPVSVNVSLPATATAKAVVGRGFGY